MSSRFVSGGTISSGGEPSKDATTTERPRDAGEAVRNTEWEAVQTELEAERKRREEQRVKAASGEERSLYDILQANKEAKQAAFEEQNKIRNQFRALDDDEAEFLDEVREAKRKEEERVRRETEDGLKAFREQQKVVGGGAEGLAREGEGEEEAWGSGRKRKRTRDRETKGVKRRVSDGDGGKTAEPDEAERRESDEKKPMPGSKVDQTTETAASLPAKKTSALGLVDYGSDDSDDD